MTASAVHLPTASPRARRIAYGIAAVALAGSAVGAWLVTGTGGWQLAAFAMGADIALLAGFGTGLERGQLHPRAVPLYNTLHRMAGPVALTGLAASGVVPAGFLAGGLIWGAHIAMDRSLGYGLRTRDGHQRA
jgi:hypothetical protein